MIFTLVPEKMCRLYPDSRVCFFLPPFLFQSLCCNRYFPSLQNPTTMDDSSDEVVKWKVIAAALHAGALDHCEKFRTTADLISYLHGYSDRLREGATAVSPRFDTTVSRRKHHDFYYHPDNIRGPVGLSVFFSDGVADPCALCKHASVTLNAGRFKYKCKATTMNFSPLRSRSPERNSSDDLNLRRLEHMAVMHTPYFVMLFLELAQQKRYSFHADEDAKRSVASYLFTRLREDDLNAFGREHDSFKFLKLWWRFQDSRSARDLKISMPSYFELCADESVWNIRSDSFGKRKPEPLYTFLEKNCLCHEMWLGGGEVAYSDDVSPSPRLTTVTRGEVSTHRLSILIPKVHLEDTLRSLVEAREDRRRAALSQGGQVSAAGEREMVVSTPLPEPELDCIILEDVGHDRAVMMHTIASMDSQWRTLSSWLANARREPPGELPVTTRNKVLLGVLGSLRDMCLQDKRPPRRLYGAGKSQESKLTEAFFVHDETGDVLSLLPFVSLPRIHRSSNIAADEENFRSACAEVASRILSANVEGERAAATTTAVSGCSSPTVHAFCTNGLADEELWRLLGPKEVGSRAARKISDMPRVWLGKDSRTIEALRGRLLELGFREPLNVTVVEFLKEDEAGAIRESRGGSTCKPEICRGLLSALTPAHSGTPQSDSSHPSSFSSSFASFSTSGSALIHDLSLRHREDIHGNKRFNDIVPDVARKLFRSDATEERVSAKERFRTDLNLTTKTFDFDDDMATAWTPRQSADETRAFYVNDETSRISVNPFFTSTSDDGQLQGVLFSVFKKNYRDEPQTLAEMIREGLGTGEHAAPDDRGATDADAEGEHSPLTPTRNRGDNDDDDENDLLICEDTPILERNKRWKTSGFKLTDVKDFGYKEYKKMTFFTCNTAPKNLLLKILTLPKDKRPVKDPQCGLIEPPRRGGWTPPVDLDLPVTLERVDTGRSKFNWGIGVERVLRSHAELCNPGIPKHTEIPRTVLNCKHEMQLYKAVDLSEPPENGFRHVQLIIGDFPTLMKKDVSNTLPVINSSETLYLGPVSTIQNVMGLLVHKIFANTDQVLQDILTLHTTLQVHPFVPRTFALHLMKIPFEHKSVVGMFVGEAAGEWNLGNPFGMVVKNKMEKFTLAYHVLQCLLRVQILCLRVLGFALKCIQPARIWRWRSGFRTDFISCLADTVHMWHRDDPWWGGLAGLATIHKTMVQLGLFEYLPHPVQEYILTLAKPFGGALTRKDHVLERPYAQRLISLDPNELLPLYAVYNMCKFAEQEISAKSDWDVVLGSERYEKFCLKSAALVFQPYGPFSIQIHHQYFKWNEAVIVEPVLNRPAHLAAVSQASNPDVRVRNRSPEEANAITAEPWTCPLSQSSVYTEY